MASEAEIEFTKREHPDSGRMQDCVIATCTASEESTDPVWGHGVASVRRALAMLKDCDCGERYHKASNGEDE